MNVRTLLAAAAMSVGFVSFAAADITGKVKLDGKAPDAKEIDMSGVAECKAAHTDPVYEEHVVADEQGNLANVVVYIKADDAAALGGEIPKEAAVLDQKGCMYEPHVLAMMVGQELKVKNDDPFLHNVHSLAQTNPAFNFGQPNKDPGKPVDPPKAAENIKVKCDVHPWMSAYIVVLEHPFFGVSKEDGTFMMPGAAALRKRYRQLAAPTVIFAGEADKIVKPDAHARRLHTELGNSVLHVLPGVGHMLHHAAPQAVAAAVTSDMSEAVASTGAEVARV